MKPASTPTTVVADDPDDRKGRRKSIAPKGELEGMMAAQLAAAHNAAMECYCRTMIGE